MCGICGAIWSDTRLGIELCEFATVGIDNDGLYIATNNFGGLSPFGLTVSVYTIPKADLLGPNPSIANLSRHEGLTATNVGYGDTLQPVVDFGTSDGGEIIGLGDSVTTFIRSTVTGADTANSTLSSPTEFTVTPYSFPGNPTTPAGFPINSTTVLPVSSPISSSVVKEGTNSISPSGGFDSSACCSAQDRAKAMSPASSAKRTRSAAGP